MYKGIKAAWQQRAPRLQPTCEASQSNLSAISLLVTRCIGSAWDGVNFLERSPEGAVFFGFVAKMVLVTHECSSC